MFNDYYDDPYDCFEDGDLSRPKHDWGTILNEAEKFEEFLGDGVKSQLGQEFSVPASGIDDCFQSHTLDSNTGLKRLSRKTITPTPSSVSQASFTTAREYQSRDASFIDHNYDVSPLPTSRTVSRVESKMTEIEVTSTSPEGGVTSFKAKETLTTAHYDDHAGERRASAVEFLDNLIPHLDTDEKVDLFRKEYGDLSFPGEKEILLREFECAYYEEVSILGITHVTNQRLAFHASLLKPIIDPHKDATVILSGTATDHRRFPHSNRKVYLEMVHDMVTAYPSARDKHRIKPLWSVMFNDIESIAKPANGNEQVSFALRGKHRKDVSFDNSEVAFEWYRELAAALFLFQHSRHTTSSSRPTPSPLRAQDSHTSADSLFPQDNSVAVQIPLEWISDVTTQKGLHDLPDAPFGTFTLHLRRHVNGFKELVFAFHYESQGGEELANLIMGLAKDRFERRKSAGDFAASEMVANFGALDPSKEKKIERRHRVEEWKLTLMGRKGLNEKRVKTIRREFGVPMDEEFFLASCKLTRFFTLGGLFAVTSRFVCYYSRNRTTLDTKYRFLLQHVKSARPLTIKGIGCAILLELEGRESMQFIFGNIRDRNGAVKAINEAMIEYNRRARKEEARQNRRLERKEDHLRVMAQEKKAAAIASKSKGKGEAVVAAADSTKALDKHVHFQASPPESPVIGPQTFAQRLCPPRLANKIITSRNIPPSLLPVMLKPINVTPDVGLRIASRHFVCLTIGSRGDVQPYIALALGLMGDGHRVTIVTHEEYKEWVQKFGIEHRTAGGDPGALMKLSVENKMFSPNFFKESLGNFRQWLDELLQDSWEQCQDADVLIESPSAMAGVHIAEALSIPYFRAFTMPWTKTVAFPHAFISPPVDSPSFNAGSYVLFNNVFWAASSGQVNKWRKNTLGIPSTDLHKLQLKKIPFLYNFSPSVVPKPLDWSDDITICGNWFLDNPNPSWVPPADLERFMARAREDERPLVYIGFGSITVPDPKGMTKNVIEAVESSGVRAIICQGWSARMVDDEAASGSDEEAEYPDSCYVVKSIPHDWLFPKIDAALHHGGAGTTGATLRAGIPTLIKPWFGDQFFWAGRVQKLGAGMEVSSLKSSVLTNCLIRATTDVVMKERASSIGVRVRAENGVKEAMRALYTYMPRAEDATAARKTVVLSRMQSCASSIQV